MNEARSWLDSRFELPQGIFDSQEYYLASGLAHVFRDPKHPAHGLNFYAKIERRIVSVRPALKNDG